MRLLAFDTSGLAISAAVADGSVVLAHQGEAISRGHAERLLPLLGEVMRAAGWAWRDLDLLAVTLGPGSFTGLRAGITVARALCLGLDCSALGLGTLEILAEGAVAGHPDNSLPIQVLADARRGEMYAQRFSADLEPLGPPEIVSRLALVAYLASPCLLVVDSPMLARELTLEGVDVIEALPDARYLVSAVERRLARGWRLQPGSALRPFYLRPLDARLSAGSSMLTSGR